MGEFVGDNLSFDGVKLLRSTYSTASLNYKQLQQLNDSSSLFIELDRRAYESAMLSEIRIVNDERVVSSHKLSKLKNIDAKVFVPMGRSFTIGCLSDLQSSPIRFVRDTNNVLHFEYVTPKYHNLYTINESGSNTIFLTTSLSQQIIEDNNLNPAETRRLIANSFRDGVFKTTGTDVDRIMPAMSRFGDSNRSGKKKGVIERLVSFFEKYFGAI